MEDELVYVVGMNGDYYHEFKVPNMIIGNKNCTNTEWEIALYLTN